MCEATCPNQSMHTPEPADYCAWFDWAKEKSKTHHQRRCPGCGRFVIWMPKAEAPKEDSDDPQ